MAGSCGCVRPASPSVASTALRKRSRENGRGSGLDVVQSASGLLLALFMWGHMAFVSTILISKDAMWCSNQIQQAISLDRLSSCIKERA